MIQTAAFYLFAALVLASGAFTIFARNPVHSVLWLIMAFFNAAGLMVLAGAEFIAMLLVIVYVGAVAVLFLFVVMMLNIDFAALRAGFLRNLPFGLLLAVVLISELIVGLGALHAGGVQLGTPTATAAPAGPSNTEAIGVLLYTRYIFLFEMAGLVLLVAMVGAIVLTHRARKDARYQSAGRQIARSPSEATRNLRPEVGQGVAL